MKRVRRDYKTIAVNLDAEQVGSLKNLSELTQRSVSFHARLAFADYLKRETERLRGGYSAPQIHSETMNGAQER